MAMSQYSYGALELAALEGEQMPYVAGFDAEGNRTCDPGSRAENETDDAGWLLERRGSLICPGYFRGRAFAWQHNIGDRQAL